MEAQVQAAVVARVDVGRIAVGDVSLGDLVVGQLRVDDASVAVRSGQALLRDVEVTMRLEFSIDWWVGIDLWFDEFSDSGTARFAPLTIPLALGDWEVPGLRNIDLDIAVLTGSNVQTRADPITGLQVNGLAAEDVRATDVVLPTPGFDLAGLALTSLTVADVGVPAARVGAATVGHVRGTPLTLPGLRLRDLSLPSAAAGDIRSGVLDVPLQRRERMELSPALNLGFLRLTPFVRPSAGTHIAQMHLTGVQASMAARRVELGNVTIPYELHNLTLADIGVHTIDVPTITVTQP